jgi:hypothetical protein
MKISSIRGKNSVMVVVLVAREVTKKLRRRVRWRSKHRMWWEERSKR